MTEQSIRVSLWSISIIIDRFEFSGPFFNIMKDQSIEPLHQATQSLFMLTHK